MHCSSYIPFLAFCAAKKIFLKQQMYVIGSLSLNRKMNGKMTKIDLRADERELL